MKVIQGHDTNAVYVQKLPHRTGWTAVQYLGTARIPTTVITCQPVLSAALAAVHRIRRAGMIAKTQVWVKYPDRFEPIYEPELADAADLWNEIKESATNVR